jgi:pimeloyl-ACP methyl ester carboxylesterase
MPETDPQLVYKVTEYHAKVAGRTVFFFCPFGLPVWLLALPGMPIWHLRRHGFAVIAYSYWSAIATGTYQQTVANIRAMIDDVRHRLSLLNPEEEISCFGTSMGTVMATNVAAEYPRIKKVILNLSYADISDHVINLPSIRTIPAKRLQAYLEAAGSEENLRAAFDPFSPVTLTHQLKGKKVLLYLSKDDGILKLIHTTKLHDALVAAGVDLEFHQNRRGRHVFALFVNYLRYRRWLQFLEQG